LKNPVWLPPVKDREKVQEALKFHRDTGLREQQSRAVEWTRTHWFIQGVRGLTILVPGGAGGGAPTPTFVDQSGQRRVRLELAVQAMQTEMGRLLGVDISPAVRRRPGISLDEVRSSSISQTVLDNFWSRFRSQEFRLALAFGLVTYGTLGIGAFEVPAESGGVYGASLFVIPPWELLPLPGGVTGADQAGGVMWRRWVPFDWLKQKYSKILKLPANEEELHLVEVPAGSHVHTEAGPTPIGGIGIPTATGVTAVGKVDDRQTAGSETVKYVEMTNVWVTADDGSCLRWCILLGDHLALDKDYSADAEKPMTPVSVARYLPVGSFWARSLLDRLTSINQELELLFGDLLQNLREMDRLRVLTVPVMSGINIRNLRQHLRNRFIPWQPDPSAPTQGPTILNPPTTADMHGRTLGMLTGLMSSLSQQGEMFRGSVPGRLDSADSLSILAEQQGVPLSPVLESLDAALTQAYRSLLGIFKRTIKDDDTVLLSRVDESVLGVLFDSKTGRIGLANNPLPVPQTVDVHMRSKSPRTKQAVKASLDQLLAQKVITPVQYRISAVIEGLDLPIANRAEYENFVTAWLENIIMFGDGTKPSSGMTIEGADNHPIHNSVHRGMIASALFRMAGPEVRDKFLEHTDMHEAGLGAFPVGLESADEFGNVGPPPGVSMQALGGMVPPRPGQTPPMEMS